MPVFGSGGSTPIVTFDAATTTASSATVAFDLTSAPQVSALGGTVFAFIAAYAFGGFLDPIDGDTSNVARAGRAIPIKWRVLDLGGNPVTALTSTAVKLTSVGIDCGGVPSGQDPVEAYAPGASALRNVGDGYYEWNWATDKAWSGTCRVLQLDLGDRNPDGSPIYRTAAFQFTK